MNVPRSDQESLLDDKRLTLVRGNSDNGDEAILLSLEGGTSPTCYAFHCLDISQTQ